MYKQLKSDDQRLPSSTDTHFLKLPYFGYQSDKLSSELRLLLSKYFGNLTFNIILTNKYTIGSFFNYKDVLPKCLQSSIVYKFCCPVCRGQYIGSSVRTFKVRCSEHIGVSHRTGLQLKTLAQSNIRAHTTNICGVSFDESDFQIIGRCSNVSSLRILESLHIFDSKPKLNDNDSAVPLYIV